MRRTYGWSSARSRIDSVYARLMLFRQVVGNILFHRIDEHTRAFRNFARLPFKRREETQVI
jgi:hypothetical protein